MKSKEELHAEKCAICMDELEPCRGGYKNAIFISCGHPFHPNCIKQIQKNECPVCRVSLSGEEMLNLGGGARNAREDVFAQHNFQPLQFNLEDPVNHNP